MTSIINTKTFSPHKVLAPYIFHYSMMKIKTKNFHELQVKTFPFALASISVGLRNTKIKQFNSKSNISTIHTSSVMGLFPIESPTYLSPIQDNTYGISILLTHRGVNKLLCLPLKELYMTNINLDSLFGNSIKLLIDQLENLENEVEMINCLDNYFIRKLNSTNRVNDPIVTKLIHLMNHSNSINSVHDLANEMNMHVRTLERKFAQNIGLRPKEFLRLTRFIRLKYYLSNAPGMHWAELILKCGFYDQPHLDHEISKVTDMSVRDFIKLAQNIS